MAAVCCVGFQWVKLVFEGSLHLKNSPAKAESYESESAFTCSGSLINCTPAFYLFFSVRQTRGPANTRVFLRKEGFVTRYQVESRFLRNKLSERYVRSENDWFSPSPLRQLRLIISRKWQGYVAYRCRGRLVCYLSLFLPLFLKKIFKPVVLPSHQAQQGIQNTLMYKLL